MLRSLLLNSVIALAALLGACGGGGGGGAGSGTVDLFLSDSFADDYAQVWLTLHRVEFRDASGTFRTVFESAEGVLFDARRLGDDSGSRFSFLGTVAVPNGTYDRVRVTLADEAVLVPSGSTTGQTKSLDDSLPRDGLGRPMAEYPLVPALVVSGPSGTQVIDFDLVAFSIDGNDDLVPSLRRGDDFGIEDSGRHEVEDYKGTVTALGASGFTLRPAAGRDIAVTFEASTPVFRGSDGQAASLANGLLVEVEGIFSVLDGALLALSIRIEDASGPDEAEAHGTIGDADLVANTLVLSDIFLVSGFTPQGTTVNVTWTDATTFRRSGDVVDETWLNTFPFAEAEGAYDADTNTIAATRVTLEDGGGQGPGEPEARGRHVGVDLAANTLTLTDLTVASGFTPQGGAVHVAWSAATVFRRSGDIVDETWLASFAFSEVKGSYDAATNTIAATRITIEDDQGGPAGGNEAEAAGTVGSLDLSQDRMTLSSLTAASGFTPQGGSLTVVWNDQTTFRFKGDTVDESLLAAYPRAEVRGTYDAGTNTITADRISPED